MNPSLPDFKRGDSLRLACTYEVDGRPTALTDTTVEAQVRRRNGELIATLIVQLADQTTDPGRFDLSADPTDAWPLGGALLDIKFTVGGVVTRSQTASLPIVEKVTE